MPVMRGETRALAREGSTVRYPDEPVPIALGWCTMMHVHVHRSPCSEPDPTRTDRFLPSVCVEPEQGCTDLGGARPAGGEIATGPTRRPWTSALTETIDKGELVDTCGVLGSSP